ncbi:uncharacterized protein [Neodiprion pinetum]|uniref:uncharacterized protein n=1 Tax=Neodiprion pinetum TaxID=441929 RepID=UPI00371D9109
MFRNRSRSTDSGKENDGGLLEKRIKRLERKLAKKNTKKKPRRRHASSSSSDSRSPRDHNLEKRRRGYESPTRNWETDSFSRNNTENGRALGSQADDTATGEVPVVEPQGDARRAEDVDLTTTRAETPPNPGVDESGGLAGNVLKAMGKRIAPDRVLGPEIPKPIAVRWEEIFKQGLPPELKTSIIEKYPPPSNCIFIDSPKVNPELKAASAEAVVKRDNRIISKQERIAACLSAQGKALATIIKRDNDADLALIESISDVQCLRVFCVRGRGEFRLLARSTNSRQQGCQISNERGPACNTRKNRQ